MSVSLLEWNIFFGNFSRQGLSLEECEESLPLGKKADLSKRILSNGELP